MSRALQRQVAALDALGDYLAGYLQRTGREPAIVDELDPATLTDPIDVVYKLDDQLHVHVYMDGTRMHYVVIDPPLTEDDARILEKVKDQIFQEALFHPPAQGDHVLESELMNLFNSLLRGKKRDELGLNDPRRVEILRYHLIRDISRYGPLQPFILDPYLEDISGVGVEHIHVIHKFFGMMGTNVKFQSMEQVDVYMRNLSERIGRPVSDARPIVDAIIAGSSRINIVYSEDVSRKGPSFTIRRIQDDPITITRLIHFGTFTPLMGAYLWMAMENGMNVFVCGATATGKSTALNACLSFVNPRAKIYTAEDTPEVRPPHPVWQRLLTQETGPEESRVRMFDLLKAALRSRPNCIIVGEIRGAEGAVAFQAMQTGHQTCATFHASNTSRLIQRLGAPPINVPTSFMDNLNIGVFIQAFHRNGRFLRRVVAIDEIEGFSAHEGGVITRPVFTYNHHDDSHTFRGMNNSYILETKIAEIQGYEEPRDIYNELFRRAKILEKMVEQRIFEHPDVNKIIFGYADRGVEALPFDIS